MDIMYTSVMLGIVLALAIGIAIYIRSQIEKEFKNETTRCCDCNSRFICNCKSNKYK